MRTIPVHVHYPLEKGQIVLRTDADWDRDVLPAMVSDGYSTFEITSDKAFVYFKPCLRREADFKWSVGANYLLLLDTDVEQSLYPCFFSSDRGSFSEVIEAPSQYYDQAHKVRVFLPPGYQENTLKHYPCFICTTVITCSCLRKRRSARPGK